MQLTKILCTLGPATSSTDRIAKLIESGMDVARFNLSHGTHESHATMIKMTREASERFSPHRRMAILIDTKGPEVRTGDRDKPLTVEANQEIVFSPKPLGGEELETVIVDHPRFGDDAKNAECIYIDNGAMSFDVIEVRGDGSVKARARESGVIGSRRHVNLPGAMLNLPSITEKDWSDIAFAVEQKADFIAVSFVRDAAMLNDIREFLCKKKSPIQLIAKIETKQGLDNLAEIIAASDAVMVARGDLGAEIPFERVPAIQDEIVARCRDAGKPVIVATQMLESMIEHPIPTRAEVTDIAYAASTRTDAVMLSSETANGKHPIQALQTISRVLEETEGHIEREHRAEEEWIAVHDEREARAEAAVILSRSIDGAAIVVFTRTGRTARDVCKFRPTIPIIAFTNSDTVQRQLKLAFGVQPLVVPFDADPEQTVRSALELAKGEGILQESERIILLSDVRTLHENVGTIQVRVV
jgi:pyruvate kinase